MESLFFDSPEWYKIHEEIINNDEYEECNLPGPSRPLPRKRCYPSRGIVEFYKHQHPGYSHILWRGFRYVTEIYMASGVDGKVASIIYIKLNDHYLTNYGIPGDHETSLYQTIMNYTNGTV